MLRSPRLALLAAICGATRGAAPSWAAERAAEQCVEPVSPPPPPAPPLGAGRRPKRRRSRSFARLLGFGASDDGGEAFGPFKLPKLGLAEAMVYCFFVMIGGLVLAANI